MVFNKKHFPYSQTWKNKVASQLHSQNEDIFKNSSGIMNKTENTDELSEII